MFNRILRKFGFGFLDRQADRQAELTISEIHSYQEYLRHSNQNQQRNLECRNYEKKIIPDNMSEFKVKGYCYVCRAYVDLLVDFLYSYEVDGVLTPNWREGLSCPRCKLNNRLRATVHIFENAFQPNPDSSIYITEQTTPLYKILKTRYRNAVGSEYLGNEVESGCLNNNGIRHEDLTSLSFHDNQFDFILSFDVFEHIQNYQKAIAQCFRCLKPNGKLLFSVPFETAKEKNTIRAHLSSQGEVVHVLPPEYHGDPLNANGLLCFYHFGWELLDELKEMGFADPKALLYWSSDFGYLGGEQMLFTASKPSG